MVLYSLHFKLLKRALITKQKKLKFIMWKKSSMSLFTLGPPLLRVELGTLSFATNLDLSTTSGHSLGCWMCNPFYALPHSVVTIFLKMSPLYRWEKENLERLNDLPKLTRLTDLELGSTDMDAKLRTHLRSRRLGRRQIECMSWRHCFKFFLCINLLK